MKYSLGCHENLSSQFICLEELIVSYV